MQSKRWPVLCVCLPFGIIVNTHCLAMAGHMKSVFHSASVCNTNKERALAHAHRWSSLSHHSHHTTTDPITNAMRFCCLYLSLSLSLSLAYPASYGRCHTKLRTHSLCCLSRLVTIAEDSRRNSARTIFFSNFTHKQSQNTYARKVRQ